MATKADAVNHLEFAAKDVVRNWGLVKEKAYQGPVIITNHGRKSHVVLSFSQYETLRQQARQVQLMSDLSPEELTSIAAGLRAAAENVRDDDTIID